MDVLREIRNLDCVSILRIFAEVFSDLVCGRKKALDSGVEVLGMNKTATARSSQRSVFHDPLFTSLLYLWMIAHAAALHFSNHASALPC